MVLYLHEDHLHISIHNRNTPWLTLISLIGGAILIIYMYFEIDFQNDGFGEIEILWSVSLLISFLTWSVVMIKDVFLATEDWHKVPMYYDRFIKE